MFDRDRCIMSLVDFLDGKDREKLKLYTRDGKEIQIPISIPEDEKPLALVIYLPTKKTS